MPFFTLCFYYRIYMHYLLNILKLTYGIKEIFWLQGDAFVAKGLDYFWPVIDL
jgi:hypothetical protein